MTSTMTERDKEIETAASDLAEQIRREAQSLGLNPHTLLHKIRGFVTLPR